LFEGERAERSASKLSELFEENDKTIGKDVRTATLVPMERGGWKYSEMRFTMS